MTNLQPTPDLIRNGARLTSGLVATTLAVIVSAGTTAWCTELLIVQDPAINLNEVGLSKETRQQSDTIYNRRTQNLIHGELTAAIQDSREMLTLLRAEYPEDYYLVREALLFLQTLERYHALPDEQRAERLELVKEFLLLCQQQPQNLRHFRDISTRLLQHFPPTPEAADTFRGQILRILFRARFALNNEDPELIPIGNMTLAFLEATSGNESLAVAYLEQHLGLAYMAQNNHTTAEKHLLVARELWIKRLNSRNNQYYNQTCRYLALNKLIGREQDFDARLAGRYVSEIRSWGHGADVPVHPDPEIDALAVLSRYHEQKQEIEAGCRGTQRRILFRRERA